MPDIIVVNSIDYLKDVGRLKICAAVGGKFALAS
jgi:hypothetical protein